jgi:formylglycine-generating enzyme
MKQPNELGLYDMLGNVDEWVSDWSVMQRPGTYVEQVTRDPTGPPTGVNKVYRGGEIFSGADDVLEWFHFHRKPDDGSAVIGFRLVREMKD